MKKGFTLIELLAVIVILAIIALIAVPIVLNIINDSKESSLLRSAEFYLSAAEYAVADAYLYHGGLESRDYPITPKGDICTKPLPCDDEHTLKVEVNGDKPTGGSITINNGNISNVNIILGDRTIIKNSDGELAYHNPVCTIERQNPSSYTTGDIITCGSEKFYLVKHENNEIKMLTQKNINATGIGDVKQMDNAGNVAFVSTDYYWMANGTIYGILLEKYATSSRPFVYDENSNLHSYIEQYNTYLNNNLNLKTLDISVLSYEDYVFAEEKIEDAGFYRPNYWLGSDCCSSLEYENSTFIYYTSSRYFLKARDDSPTEATFNDAGIRPLLTISTSDIK